MYEIVRLIEPHLLDDMLSLYKDGLLTVYDSRIFDASSSDKLSKKTRSSKNVKMSPLLFPEICGTLEEHLKNHKVLPQFDFLIYEVGDFFCRHKDNYGDNDRTYTTVTMMEKSDDLVGGDLVIYDEEETFVINLEVGETIIFPASMYHEAKVVEQGSRKVLVAWLN